MKLNLGGGKVPVDGYVNIDIMDKYSDVGGLNLETQSLPYEDNSVDEIYSHHCIEHLHEVQNVFNEAWRVLKPGGVFKVVAPYGLWAGASKPVHYQMITECWFDFFRRPDIKEIYGYKSWDILRLEVKQNKQGEKYEVVCQMKPRKN